MASRNTHRDMTLWGISDSELLAIVDDLADENGWVSTPDVRLQLGENPEEEGRSGVGSRLAWMRRYGWLEGGGKSGSWRLTAVGHALIDQPKLAKSVDTALANLNPAQRVHVARVIGEAAASGASEVRNALRREWRRNTEPHR